jgi:hypothetical protein
MFPIRANLQAVQRRILEALQGDSRAVRLVAVSKARAAAEVAEAREAGCRDFGENYVQEALAKMDALAGRDITWHFIGRIQGNKARVIAERFDWVHAIDRERIAQALSRARPADRGPLSVCLQVNISEEDTKGGLAPAEALGLARSLQALPGLKLRGLMGMASPTGDRALQREQFRALRQVYDGLRADGLALDTLSMGMSDDFESAIAEGSTLVRVGTAIFGPRAAGPAVHAAAAPPG